ncbi:MAG: ankyrin repeat domain-containing protein [Gammaproteobacteria bacterium]|nr:ankyrin repeat domain-containing protein [Gammaproteobacteria bacterium]
MIHSGNLRPWAFSSLRTFRCFPGLVYPLLVLALLTQVSACSSERYTALMNAARNGDTEAVRKMLDLGADADQKTTRGKTALMLAAAGGYTDTVKLLADRGADVNTRDNYDTTAIIAAATAGHPETSATLLAYGADPMFKDTSGGSALSNATFFGHTETVLAMLERIPELPAETGNELLLLAAGLGHEKIAAALLNKGISVNARGIKGRTPLMAAAAFNKPELVKLLLANSADAAISDEEGVTALQVAENKGNQEIITRLRAAQPVTGVKQTPASKE